ncbi:MAG: ribose 5-phosphate isomerase B [Dehalococcoidales bacterium]|jgi:ribose 5-phosphate isomerase B
MKVAVGSDHRGLKLKDEVIRLVADMGHEVQDCGAYDTQSVDYPDIAQAVGKQIAGGRFERGILICGTGIGMSIAANKIKGIRAALCCDAFMAERARLHNDANVLCLGVERTTQVPEIVRVFLTTGYEGGRHQQRLDKIENMESG